MKTLISPVQLSAVGLTLTVILSCIPVALAAQEAPLQAETPTEDTTAGISSPISSSDPSQAQTAPSAESKIHKLEVNTNEMGEGANTNAPGGYTVQLAPGQGNIQINGVDASGISIRVQQYRSQAGMNSAAASPFGLLQAMFGHNSRSMHNAYAECDTGYGVCGVALNKGLNGGYARIYNVFPSMPAKEAGILPGDVVLSVNGKSTNDIGFSEVWDWFTGLPGTPVTLMINRNGQKADVTLKRMDIGRIPDFGTRAGFLSLYRMRGASKFLQQQSDQPQP